jgi:hypothetical protein
MLGSARARFVLDLVGKETNQRKCRNCSIFRFTVSIKWLAAQKRSRVGRVWRVRVEHYRKARETREARAA